MLTAMARELVENKGIGESADSVWRALGQLRPSSSASSLEEPEEKSIEQAEGEDPMILPLISESIRNAGVVEAGNLPHGSSRKSIEQAQLSLF
jgi:hypothetical protein